MKRIKLVTDGWRESCPPAIVMYGEIIAEYFNLDVEVVGAHVRRANNLYHIPPAYYGNHRLWEIDYGVFSGHHIQFGKKESIKHQTITSLPWNSAPGSLPYDDMLEHYHQEIMADRDANQKRLMEIIGWDQERVSDYCDSFWETYHKGEKTILDGELYSKTEEEIIEYLENKKTTAHDRENRIMEATGWERRAVKKHINKAKAIFGIANGLYECSKCYDCTDEELATFANLWDSRRLAAKYNNDPDVLYDKVRFDRKYKKYLGRKVWVNKDTNFMEFLAFSLGLRKGFLKPVDLHGGMGTKIITMNRFDPRKKYKLYKKLINEPKLILEEVIKQHPDMAAFYPGSINTVRIFSIVKEGKIDNFASFVRFGVTGIADNISTGGIGCGVDVETGIIETPAMGEDGILRETHPVSGLRFQGFQIPYWDEILKMAGDALRSNPGVDFVGWDFAITPKGPVIVEGNTIPCLSIYQSFYAYKKDGRKHLYEKYL